jgi:hypothetical protein
MNMQKLIEGDIYEVHAYQYGSDKREREVRIGKCMASDDSGILMDMLDNDEIEEFQWDEFIGKHEPFKYEVGDICDDVERHILPVKIVAFNCTQVVVWDRINDLYYVVPHSRIIRKIE